MTSYFSKLRAVPLMSERDGSEVRSPVDLALVSVGSLKLGGAG